MLRIASLALLLIPVLLVAFAIRLHCQRAQRNDKDTPIRMLKLYRRATRQTNYWETWEGDDWIFVHHGVPGDTGRTTRLPRSAASRDQVRAEARRQRLAGYAEVPDEALATVLLQYRLETWGTEEDLQRRHKVQDLMDNCLGWTGLGHCDGGDIGSGTMNVCCLVVDPDVAIPVIVRELKKRGHLDRVTIAIETDHGFDVRWPPDYKGKFTY
jgi:hypothetical protein